MTSPRHKIHKRFAFLLISMLISSASAFDMTKSADDYFHGGAMYYLSNNIPAALGVVTNGLNQYPDSEKLQKLEALLKQQQQNQQEQQQQDQQKEQQDQPQQNQDQQNQQQQPDQQKEQPPKDQSAQQNSGKPEEQQNAQAQQSAAEQQQEMTPEQALRLLDSTKGEEAVLPIQKAQPPANRPFKDW
jgi:membrane protein involved in colicin uptake